MAVVVNSRVRYTRNHPILGTKEVEGIVVSTSPLAVLCLDPDDYGAVYGNVPGAQFKGAIPTLGLVSGESVIVDLPRLQSGLFQVTAAGGTLIVPTATAVDVPLALQFGNESLSNGDADVSLINPAAGKYVISFGSPIYGQYLGGGLFQFTQTGGGTFPAGTVFTTELVQGTLLGTGSETILDTFPVESAVSNLSTRITAPLILPNRIDENADQLAIRISHNQGGNFSLDLGSGQFMARWIAKP